MPVSAQRHEPGKPVESLGRPDEELALHVCALGDGDRLGQPPKDENERSQPEKADERSLQAAHSRECREQPDVEDE